MRAVFIHGSCVRDGAWWWSRVATLLQAEGVDSVAARLPSCGENGEKPGVDGPSLDADVAELRRVLGEGGPAAVVVGHSYGGVVATEALRAGDAAHLMFVTSVLPEVGRRPHRWPGLCAVPGVRRPRRRKRSPTSKASARRPVSAPGSW